MARTRAKFICNWVRDHGGGSKIIQLGVVYSRVEGTENHDFTKATPSGHVEMQIDNPDAAVQFKPGHFYYVDFTEAYDNPQDGYKAENLNPGST